MTPAEEDAWASFVVNFMTRAPEADRRAVSVASFFVLEACRRARERNLALDEPGKAFVERIIGRKHMTKSLTKTEPPLVQLSLFDLEALEVKVKEGLSKFMEVGNALAEIQEKEGWKLRGCKSFEDYCIKQFGFSLRQGQRMIAAAATADKVKQLTGEAPRNEAVARVIAPVVDDEKTVQKVVTQLKRSGNTLATATAEKVQEVIARVTGKVAPADNGKDGKGKQEILAPVPASIAALGDACPNCAAIPDSYVHKEERWLCGYCDQPVLVAVSALKGKACPECGKTIGATDRICDHCGAVLK